MSGTSEANFFESRRDRLTTDLSGASLRGEISAMFQPQFSIVGNRVVGAEILSRWNHPTLGLIPPAVFIPLAEVSGAIGEIGNHMITLAAAALARWTEQSPTVDVAVNVSLLQLRVRTFAEDVRHILEECGAPLERLVAEITESTPYTSVPEAAQSLRDVAATGVTVSIDDFGSGHSSRAQVDALPATELKLDQQLIHDETSGGDTRLREAVAFGKERGMRIVAEGVETQTQLDRVASLEVDRAQGYLLGEPVDEDEFVAMLGRAE